jgi:hypothetical protein
MRWADIMPPDEARTHRSRPRSSTLVLAMACAAAPALVAFAACGDGTIEGGGEDVSGAGGYGGALPGGGGSGLGTGGTSAGTGGSAAQKDAGASGGGGGSGPASADAGPDGSQPTNYPEAGTLCSNGDGLYCGSEVGKDPSTLYQCKGGTPIEAQKCSGTCIIKPGGTDACPCPNGNGLYCGSEVGADANTLYDCEDGALSVKQKCPSACNVAPPGQNDSCAGCPSGNGLYCGSEVGADANTLYDCQNGALTEKQKCSGACKVNPPGTPDACGGCPSGNGLYCGSEVGADANTLYDCQNGTLTVKQVCSGACKVAPPGTPDSCSGSCPNGNGLYCGQEVGADSNVLYQCTDGNLSAAQQCNGACVVMPPGTPDACPSSCGGAGQAALAWEAGQLANGNSWSDLCLGFVNQAFKQAGMSIPELQKASAKDSLHTYQGEGKLVVWGGSAPCGAIVFWEGNSCNGWWGHVVIANGDGTVSTSGWPGYGGSAHAGIGWLDQMECGHAPAGYVVP